MILLNGGLRERATYVTWAILPARDYPLVSSKSKILWCNVLAIIIIYRTQSIHTYYADAISLAHQPQAIFARFLSSNNKFELSALSHVAVVLFLQILLIFGHLSVYSVAAESESTLCTGKKSRKYLCTSHACVLFCSQIVEVSNNNRAGIFEALKETDITLSKI